jgi:hypothetical protein
METSDKQWRLTDRIGLAALLVAVVGVVGTWLAVPGFRDFLRLGSPPPSVRTINGSDLNSKTAQPGPKAKSEPTTQPAIRTSQDERPQAVHNSSGPVLSVRAGDLLLRMRECTPTGDTDYAIRCVGTIENERDFKIRVTFTNGRVIDDRGNEYPLSVGPYLLFNAGGLFLGAGCCSQELIPSLPVNFGFGIVRSMSRDATSTSLILDFTSSGSPSQGQVVFRGIPIRAH